MFTFSKRLGLAAFLLLALSLSATAASKIAIVKVMSGSATLDGVPIARAIMADEGQVLEVQEGAQVRIQLLGGKEEVTLTGRKTLVVSKAEIRRQATPVSRNSASVAADIGNRNTALARVTRVKGLKLEPKLPPVLEDRQYVINYSGGDLIELPPGLKVAISVSPLGEGSELEAGHVFTHSDPLVPVRMPTDFLKVGQPYNLKVKYIVPTGGETTYEVTFRILDQEQDLFLREAEKELVRVYQDEKDIYPLLSLAALYQEYDQNDKVLKYLKMAYESQYLGNKNEWGALEKTIGEFDRALMMRLPLSEKR